MSETARMTKYTKIEQMVHEMLLTDKAIPWTASTSERSKMRMKREEHYSVYRAILRAHGGEARGFFFFHFFCIFFQHVKKLLNF